MAAPQTLRHHVVATIRHRIATNELAPGSRVHQAALAAELSVSVTPVREALYELAAQGLVEIHPRKGATIASFTVVDLAQIYELRRNLEGTAVQIAAQNCRAAPDANRDALAELADLAGRMFIVDDRQSWYGYNAAFHKNVYRLSQNRHLCALIDRLHDSSEPYIRLFLEETDLLVLAREHEEILDAVRAGDGDVAAERLAAHLSTTERDVRQLLEAAQAEPAPSADGPGGR